MLSRIDIAILRKLHKNIDLYQKSKNRKRNLAANGTILAKTRHTNKMTTENTIEQKLAAFFGVELEAIEETNFDHYGLTVVSIDGKEYAVGNDSECDDAWNQALDSYLEECVYPELKGTLANYFDDEKWKRDAKFDGRGHSLSSYDGEEIELGGDLYAYRIN